MMDLRDAVLAGDRSPVAVTDTYLDGIDAHDGEINAYVTVTDELAREGAEATEAAIAAGDDRGRLAGMPLALKELRQF